VKLYLHIGTEKTGTTSVQKFFRVNRDLLAEHAVLYPITPGNQKHQRLAVAALQLSKLGEMRKAFGVKTHDEARKFRDDLVNNLTAEFSRKPYESVVISSEHLSSRVLDDEEVQWLKDLLSPYFEEITIIVYIRRQDDFLLSTYSTSIKSGVTEMLAMPTEQLIEARYNHWATLSRWARVFGREHIVCRRFERSGMVGGDIVDDFLAIAGVDKAGYERPEDVNESLDAESLEFLRLFNQHVPRFAQGDNNPTRDNIVPLLSKISRGPLLTLPAEDLAGFVARFQETNRMVANEYFGGVRSDSDDPLFEPRSDKRERIEKADLTLQRAIEMSAWLWQEKQAQLNRVRERVKKQSEGPGPRGRRGNMAKKKDGPKANANKPGGRRDLY
jgi:hypothetical protein